MMEMMHTNYIEMMIILNGFRFSSVYVYWNVNVYVYVEMMIIMIILNVYVYIEMWRLYWNANDYIEMWRFMFSLGLMCLIRLWKWC